MRQPKPDEFTEEPTMNCWEWQRCRNAEGYGQVSFDGNRVPQKAYRVYYEEMIGPIPEGLSLDHLCRNPACVNPGHLDPVTHVENIMRGQSIPARNARKTHCLNGHPLSGDNLYIFPKHPTHRQCKTCKAERQRLSRARQRESQQREGGSNNDAA